MNHQTSDLDIWFSYAAQKMKFSIKDFFSKCDHIRRKLRIWSHLLKKVLIKNLIFCAVLCSFFSFELCLILYVYAILFQHKQPLYYSALIFYRVESSNCCNNSSEQLFDKNILLYQKGCSKNDSEIYTSNFLKNLSLKDFNFSVKL